MEMYWKPKGGIVGCVEFISVITRLLQFTENNEKIMELEITIYSGKEKQFMRD